MSFNYLKFECVINNLYSALVLFVVLAIPAWNRAVAMPDTNDTLFSNIPKQIQSDAIGNAQKYSPATQTSSTDTQLVKTLTQIRQGDEWSDQTRQIFIYNEKGLCEEVVDYVNGNNWIAIGRKVYCYDSENRLVEALEQRKNSTIDWKSYKKYSYSYNDTNQLSDEIIQLWREEKWLDYRRYTYYYDVNRVLIEKIESASYRSSPWHLLYKTTYYYNDQKQLSMILTQKPFGDFWANNKKGIYTYRPDGNLDKFIEYEAASNFSDDWEPRITEVYSYNELDQLVNVDYNYIYKYSPIKSIIAIYEYDETGKLSREEVETSTGGNVEELTQTFYYYNDYAEDELKYYGNQADYLIVAPLEFHNSLLNYASFRHDEDFNAMIVDIEQIITEFTDLNSEQEAIRKFISYTQQHWAEKPKYVLLVGDTDIIPAYMVSSSIEDEGAIPIDEWYTINQFDEDSFPDLAIGRWPVKNESELESIIQKTIAFESGQGLGQSFKKLLFLNDEEINSSTRTVFEDLSSTFMSTIVPPYISADRVDIRGDSQFHDSKQSFIDDINNGIGNLIYYGHGTPTSWSRQNYLTIDDVSSLDSNGHPFLLATMGCSQNFALPEEQSLVEEMLLFPNGGAAVTIASSGLNGYIAGDRFISNVYSRLFQNPENSLGEIILEVKQDMYTENTKADDMTRRFTLLGDPCLKIPLWAITNISEPEEKYPNDFFVYQNYPNPFNPTTNIQFRLPTAGPVELTVFDLTGRAVHSIENQHFSAGSHTLQINGQQWPSGVYHYQLRFDGSRTVKKCLLMK
jgi:hypothetical protein